MNTRAITTVLVCLAVVFAGCAGMNGGAGGDSAGNGTTVDTASGSPGDTTTAPSDTTTTSGDDGTTTQSETAESETPTRSATSAATTTPATTSAGEPTTISETDTTVRSGGGDSTSLSNPFTEGEYYRITVKIDSSSRTVETTFEWRVLSVDGEQVTIKVTNPKTGKSTTTQSDWRQVASNLNTKSISSGSIIPLNIIYPLLRAPVVAAQAPSVTATGTDTVAGVNCKRIELSGTDTEVSRANGEITACVNKDVSFALYVAVSASGKTTMTITVEEYRSGDGG